MQKKPSEHKTSQQLAQSFITYFSKLYKEKYGYFPDINRYTAKYPVIDILQDLSYTELLDVTKYYFTLETKHSISDLATSYYDVISLRKRVEEDIKLRRSLRQKTKEKVRLYRETYE